jgi:hypothetical protein
MEAYTHTKQTPTKSFICFQTEFTKNGAIQAQPHSSTKSPAKLTATLLRHASQRGGPMASTSSSRIQAEFGMHNLNRISAPTSSAPGKRKNKLPTLET